MLSKEEFKAFKFQFWNDLKIHLAQNRSSNGRKINWLNYPSEIKDIYVRLEVDKKGVRVCFDIQAKDEGVRAILWEQMTELKKIMEETMELKGEWIEHHFNETLDDFGRIQWEAPGLNYLKPEDRAAIFAFFEKHLVQFDLFYQEFKDILILLAK